SGMRVAFAPFIHDVFDHEFLQIALPPELRTMLDAAPRSSAGSAERMYRDLASRWRGHPRVTILLGPNAFQRCSPALLALWRRLAHDLGLHAHTHLVETRIQAERGRAAWPGGTVEEMARAGLLSERLSVAHGVWLTPDEGEILARHGVTVVHNPASNLMLGSGRIEPGQRADLVLLDPRGAALAGAPVTVAHLVQHAGASAVAAVMINGSWALRDGRIVAFNEAAVLDEVAAISAEVRATAGPE